MKKVFLNGITWVKYEDLKKTPERISQFMTRARHGSIFQNPQWYFFTEEKTSRFTVIAALRQGRPVFASLIRKTSLPGTGFCVGTIERGPVFDDIQLAIALWRSYEHRLVESGFGAIFIHPFWKRSESQELQSALQRHGYVKSPKKFHTETLTLDLTPSEENIFNSMKSSRRNQIRKAAKIGIEVHPVRNRAEMKIFWDMYRDLCVSKGLSFWPRKRFEAIRRFSRAFPSQCACLLGWLKGELVGGNIILRHSSIAEVARGGGSIKVSGIPKTDLILWESIRWAKRVGATTYDFGGFDPSAEKGSPEWGVNRFKLEFTKHHVALFEPMEKIFNPNLYGVFDSLRKVKNAILRHLPIRLPA